MSFVDAHRGELGVEPICTALQVAPSTYYAAKHREREPSARAVRDAVWMPILLALWVANRKVYGARKLWKAARRAGHEIGREVARLMREPGVRVASAGGARCSPPAAILTRFALPTWSTGTSLRIGPTRCG